MVSPLSVHAAKGYEDLRSKIYEVEEHIREAHSLKNGSVADEIKKVTLMKILFEELRLHVRRRGFLSDRYSYDEVRAFLMEKVATKDEEKAARGSLRNAEESKTEHDGTEQGMWLEDFQGEWSWLEVAQINALLTGK